MLYLLLRNRLKCIRLKKLRSGVVFETLKTKCRGWRCYYKFYKSSIYNFNYDTVLSYETYHLYWLFKTHTLSTQ